MNRIGDIIGEYLPLMLIIVFALIGFGVGISFQSIELFLTLFGLGISVAVVQCALIQNRIQRDNIKIQLFEKKVCCIPSIIGFCYYYQTKQLG